MLFNLLVDFVSYLTFKGRINPPKKNSHLLCYPETD